MEKNNSGLAKANEIFRNIVRTACGIAVTAIFLLIIVQVFFRYVLKTSMGGMEELPTYIMAIACWMAVPVAAIEDNHINIDLIPNLFHGRARLCWSMWAELVEVVTMTVFTKLALDYTIHMMETGNVTGGTGIPLFYPSVTSRIIITTKPRAKATVPAFECRPSDISGISSSTTTYIIAPAAKARK